MDLDILEDFEMESFFFSHNIKDIENNTFLEFLTAPGQNWTQDYNNSVLEGFYDNVPFSGNGSIFIRIIHYLDLYFVPLMVVVGLLGNLISFLVFVGTYMRRLSSSVYLAALSMVDMVFLMCVLVSWGVNIGVHTYHKDGWCQMFIYFTYVSSFLSVWYVVSFTVERYIAVHYPLRRYEFCTTNRAKIVVLSLACFAAVIYSFGTWTSGVSRYFGMPICGPLPQYSYLVHMVHNVDTVITLILPFLAILFLNVRIALKVMQFYRTRRSVTEQPVSTSRESDSGFEGSNRFRITVHYVGRTGHLRNQVRVTKMLLTVSSIFLLLNLPRHSERVYLFIRSLSELQFIPGYKQIVWQRVFQFLYYLHFCVNVFLYSALGTNFRKAFFCLMRRMKHAVIYATGCICRNPCWHSERTNVACTPQAPNVLLRDLVGDQRPTCASPLPSPADFRYKKCRSHITHCFIQDSRR